jgi:hypothetical protein
LKRKIERAARQGERSCNKEMVLRLEASFGPALTGELIGLHETLAKAANAARTIHTATVNLIEEFDKRSPTSAQVWELLLKMPENVKDAIRVAEPEYAAALEQAIAISPANTTVAAE